MRSLKPDLHVLVICLAAVIFLKTGAWQALHDSCDFVPVFTGARCLLAGCNPYEIPQLKAQFLEGGGRANELSLFDHETAVYPPSTLLVLSPLALFKFPVARLLWALVNTCLFIGSVVLVLSIRPQSLRWLTTAMAAFILITSGPLVRLGQPGAFAISLLIISVVLFLRGKYVSLATVLLILSLAVKPQIGGLVALYLVWKKIYRRHALVALGGTLAILLLSIFILHQRPGSAGWNVALRSNLADSVIPGAINDPRPTNFSAIGDVNLQTVTSVFLLDAKAFNDAAYGIFLALLIVWLLVMIKADSSTADHWIAIAALTVLTLLPVYHRFYDTRMLLISVLAFPVIFQRNRILGVAMTVLTALAVVSIQNRLQLFFLHRGELQNILQHRLLFLVLLRQQTLELLLLFFGYVIAIGWMAGKPKTGTLHA